MLQQYLQSSPDCVELFALLDGTGGSAHGETNVRSSNAKRDTGMTIARKVVDLMAAVVSNAGPGAAPSVPPPSAAASAPLRLHPTAYEMCRRMLRTKMKVLYRLLSAVDNRVVHSPLRFLVAVVSFAGIALVRELSLKFNFQFQAFARLAFRAHSASSSSSDGHRLAAHTTRLLFIELALSFLELNDAELTRSILSQQGFVSSILKGLPQDDADTIIHVVAVLLRCVVQHDGVPLSAKSAFFNSYVMEQLIRLYDVGDLVADRVHELLTKLIEHVSRASTVSEG